MYNVFMRKKHAYLIMAHHQPEIVQELLYAIDDERNDIFLHIDSKSLQKYDWNALHTYKSNLYRTPSISVNWGGYSQVKAMLILMEYANNQDDYHYYHFMTGASYPLKTQDEIHTFFDQQDGTCFVACEHNPQRYNHRVQYIHLFNESCLFYRSLQSLTKMEKIKRVIAIFFIKVQRKLNYDHFKSSQMVHKKGLAYWSLPQDAIQYVLSKKKQMEPYFKYAHPADESYMQTLLFNSPFQSRLYCLENECSENLIITTWPLENMKIQRHAHAFTMEDWKYLHQKDKFFGLKFVGDTGLEIIQKLKEEKKGSQR